jgi:large subunit ribosomal protein L19
MSVGSMYIALRLMKGISLEEEFLKKRLPRFNIGDTVDVHIKIKEADKERIQIFSGIVIARRGSGLSETFTVRRIVQGEGVERIFPLHSPRIQNIKVKKRGKVRRAKLYYLRQRIGRATKVAEKIFPTKPEESTQEELQEKKDEPVSEG